MGHGSEDAEHRSLVGRSPVHRWPRPATGRFTGFVTGATFARGQIVDYRILGSFEIYDGGVLVTPGAGRQRALLALLLLRANETVQSETLVDELWEESPPPSAAKIVQNYVSQLRRALGDGVLVTRGRGYALRVEPGEIDVDRFAQQLEIGRRALASNEPELAAATLSAALELWRGPPLVDFADE